MKVASPPVGGLLYSLIHLGGFAGDLKFYAKHTERARVIEFGCGDGRIAAHLNFGQPTLSILQQQLQREENMEDELEEAEEPWQGCAPCETAPTAYLGIELCEPLARKARERLSSAESAEVRQGDFLQPLREDAEAAFDAALVSANTLFATPDHETLLIRCSEALEPGGVLLLDVYNALLYHDEGWEEEEDQEEEDVTGGDAAQALEEDESSLVVQVQDEAGSMWKVYEKDPDVDVTAKRITCHYEFRSSDSKGTAEGGEATFREDLVHHYLLPEDLVLLLDRCGFEIRELHGNFDGATFDPEESEHVVVVAAKKS